MVYTGKPSKACARCRARRLKCDLGQPGCRKCANANAVCSGYRNQQDLMFHDMTDQVIDKHLPTRTTSPHDRWLQPSLEAEIRPPSVNSDCVPSSRGRGDDATLDVALTFLFKCYLRGSSFEWVPKMYENIAGSTIFSDIVHATALAAYSHETHRGRLLMQARTMYNHALCRLREVIVGTDSATDTTLASILLMSRFETLLNDGNRTSITETWSNHVSGAFAIVQARHDSENYDDPMSCALVEQTIHNYNLYCLVPDVCRPPSLSIATDQLCRRLGQFEDGVLRELRLRFHNQSSSFGEYRKSMQKDKETDRLRLVEWAHQIEEQLVQFLGQLSAVSKYQTLPMADLRSEHDSMGLSFYGDVCHIYRNHWEARLWNGVRMLRLTICEDIREHECALNQGNQDELHRKIAIPLKRMDEMAAEICASAPQFFHIGTDHCTHAAACFLAWPLFVAGRASQGPRKDFVREALKWISYEFNIKSAQIAASSLDEPEYCDDWLRACYMF